MATGKWDTHKIMYTHNGKGLRQCDLFPRGGHSDRAYRAELAFTKLYDGNLATLDALLAAGEKVTLLDGQERSDDPKIEIARFETAMVGMSPNTKLIFLADCAATKLPPPCRLHSINGANRLPWQEAVTKLVAAGVIPPPWRAADGSVHEAYVGQTYSAKVGTMMAAEVSNDGRRKASEDAARARLPNGSSTSNKADYWRGRWQAIVALAARRGVPIPKRTEVRANPDVWEPELKQPKFADGVICQSCGFNVALACCGGMVLWPHNHRSGIALITRVCRRCDTCGRPVNDDLLAAGVGPSDVLLASEVVLRVLGRGGDVGEVSTRADAIVAKARAACARAKWAARDTPPEQRATRKSRRLNPSSSDDEEMGAAQPPSPASSSRSPSPPPPPSPSPPPRRRSPRNSAPGSDEATFDEHLADVARLLDKMAVLSSERAGRAREIRGDVESLRS